MDVSNWNTIFKDLSGGHDPWPWQSRLGDMLADGRWPDTITVPTGAGKTAIITLWLSALVDQVMRSGAPRLPRRLVYVVHSRTIVDQATTEARQLLERLTMASEGTALRTAVLALRSMRTFQDVDGDAPILVRTLRGELARDDSWAEDPTAATIIIGTVDLIGSRLLFSGYGDGPYFRPHYAGLLGVDTLIVHDEAHLTPHFTALLRRISEIQNEASAKSGLPRMGVVTLSATPANVNTTLSGDLPMGTSLNLDSEDLRHEELSKRLTASKSVLFIQVGRERESRLRAFVEQALTFEDRRRPVLLYVSSAKDAQDVARRLRNALRKSDRVRLLTGAMRGIERDDLATDDVFTQFLAGKHLPDGPQQTVYLVSTSAGEVGLDLDAADAIMDLMPPEDLWKRLGPTFDMMQRIVQRFGRVNRSGTWEDSRIILLHTHAAATAETPMPSARAELYEWQESQILRLLGELRSVNGEVDASVIRLSRLMSENGLGLTRSLPFSLPLQPWMFDGLAATSSARHKHSPSHWSRPVALYLHGPEPADPPTVSLIWRSEWPALIREVSRPTHVDFTELVSSAVASEVVKVPVWDTPDLFLKLSELGKPPHIRKGTSIVCVVSPDGSAKARDLAGMVEAVKRDVTAFQNCVIILDPELGGLDEHGVLDPSVTTAVDKTIRGDPVFIVRFEGDSWTCRDCLSAETLPNTWATEKEVISSIGDHYDPVAVETDEDGDVVKFLVRAKVQHDNASHRAYREQTLVDHRMTTRSAAVKLCAHLALPAEVAKAIVLAAEHHDDGKTASIWQDAARPANGTYEQAMAKTPILRPERLQNYRHELGSVVGSDESALVRHLIAAHHRHGRPGFPAKAALLDQKRDYESAGRDLALGHVQGNVDFGYWGLAYLEALVRVSDHHGEG